MVSWCCILIDFWCYIALQTDFSKLWSGIGGDDNFLALLTLFSLCVKSSFDYTFTAGRDGFFGPDWHSAATGGRGIGNKQIALPGIGK